MERAAVGRRWDGVGTAVVRLAVVKAVVVTVAGARVHGG